MDGDVDAVDDLETVEMYITLTSTDNQDLE